MAVWAPRHWRRTVAARARAEGVRRLYWQTHVDNLAGRLRYDKVAQHHGFIVYAQDL
jgi:hypothetical protein